MTKTYAWTTARGAKVVATITSEHITHETAYADGYNIEVACSKYSYRVEDITVNGKPTAYKELWWEKGMQTILIDRRGADRILVLIPDDICAEIYGEEREENRRKMAAAEKADAAYKAYHDMMRKAMDP